VTDYKAVRCIATLLGCTRRPAPSLRQVTREARSPDRIQMTPMYSQIKGRHVVRRCGGQMQPAANCRSGAWPSRRLASSAQTVTLTSSAISAPSHKRLVASAPTPTSAVAPGSGCRAPCRAASSGAVDVLAAKGCKWPRTPTRSEN
jgi:hypothetical protein